KNKKQDVTTATLDTLLKSLPPSAYLYFCSRLIESEMTGADPVKMELLSKTLLITQLRAFISQCNEKDLLELFGALYEGYRERLAELEEVDDDQIS
uniref:hypothetical protein n=1 Tax=Sphaerothrix gracilis TaxID=3151835 RepID=UPI0031FBBFE6